MSKKNTQELYRYILYLEERIFILRKAGKDTSLLNRNRALALQQLNAGNEATPTTEKEFEAVKTKI